ncbi:hypothetical protein BH10ACT1_BH10ACT1_42520 [soil metagenome]
MTITEIRPVAAAHTVTADIYRNIHKAIRADLFHLVLDAGRTDAGSDQARAELATRVQMSMTGLEVHAGHEDEFISPVLVQHLPEIADRIESDHHAFEGRGAYLCDLAGAAVEASGAERRILVHQLYLDLAGFTSSYLAHQDLEERTLTPALEALIGPEGMWALDAQIVGSMAPEELAHGLSMMLPAMNLDDRAEMLGGMQAGAPAEVFDGLWSIAGTVLAPADHAALAYRLGLD